jgi:hypothetical protein
MDEYRPSSRHTIHSPLGTKGWLSSQSNEHGRACNMDAANVIMRLLHIGVCSPSDMDQSPCQQRLRVHWSS